MAVFKVSVINTDRERDYYDYWDKGVEVNDNGDILAPDIVGFEEIAEADNLKDAIKKIRQKHPNNQIAEKYSCKIA